MYYVFWVQEWGTDKQQVCGEWFPEMGEALKMCERQRNAGCHFVSLASENPDNVTKMGVDVTGPEYNWKKRRI